MDPVTDRITSANGRNWILYQVRGDGTVELLDIAVNTDRRQGSGKALLEALFARVQDAQTVYAITRASNLIAITFYEACGFEVTGVLKRFYDRGAGAVDAILYGRSPRGPL